MHRIFVLEMQFTLKKKMKGAVDKKDGLW